MEARRRSFTKGISWRVVGTLDTILISYILTGQFPAALSIGAIELVTKIFLYYVHERLWFRVSWGYDKNLRQSTHQRSLVKGFSWRMLGTLDTIVISFFVTGVLKLALSIGAVEFFTKIFLYYLHERAWEKVGRGKSFTS